MGGKEDCAVVDRWLVEGEIEIEWRMSGGMNSTNSIALLCSTANYC